MWRMKVAQWVLVSLLVAVAQPAAATDAPPGQPEFATFRVVPAQPTTRDFIAIRNDFTGCNIHGPIKAQGIRIDLAAHVVDYLVPYGNDEADCLPEDYVEGAFADSFVGYLPAGSYIVHFFHCTILYEPETVCEDEDVTLQLQFVVTEAGRPRATIPASSWASKLALGAALAAIALWLLRLRR
jgi:hypothetical protein